MGWKRRREGNKERGGREEGPKKTEKWTPPLPQSGKGLGIHKIIIKFRVKTKPITYKAPRGRFWPM